MMVYDGRKGKLGRKKQPAVRPHVSGGSGGWLPTPTITDCAGKSPSLHLQEVCSENSRPGCRCEHNPQPDRPEPWRSMPTALSCDCGYSPGVAHPCARRDTALQF
jgi:hypothetical protein